METKNLKHRKRQKKNISGTDKGKADVLVVPPDILKKLGISIGSTNTHHQIPNKVNNPQNTFKNDFVNGLPTTKVNQKSSESSILKTASLMKESVFLSPTFVPTIANMISGEVEISNVKNNNASKICLDSCVLETIQDRSVHCESTSTNKDNQKKYQNNGNLESNFVINGVQSITSNVIKNISTESEIYKQLGRNEIVLDNSNITDDYEFNGFSKHGNQSSKSEVNRHYSDLMQSVELNAIRSSGIMSGSSNFKYDTDFIETSKTKSNRDFLIDSGTQAVKNISLENNAVQVAERSADDNLKSLNDKEIVKNISVEKKANQNEGGEDNNLKSFTKSEYALDEVTASNVKENIMEQDNIDKNFSLLKKTEIETEQTAQENLSTTISLKSCHYSNKCTEVNNIDIISPEGKAMQIKQNSNSQSTCIEHAQNNMFSLEEIQGSKSLNKHDEIGTDISLGGNNTYLQLEDNTISLKYIRNENTFPVNNSNIIFVEDNKIEKKTMSVESFVIHEKENLFDKKPISLKHASMHIKNGEKDKNANCLNCMKNDKRSLDEQLNLPQNTCKHITCTRSVQAAPPLNLSVDDNVTSATNVGENISHGQKTLKPEKIGQNQECEMAQNLCNGNLKDTIENGFDVKSTDTIADVGVPVHKIVHKINIISEEIIPPLDFKELRKAHSPAIKSLTPVPLNSIIAPKRNNEYISEMKAVDKGSTLILKQTEVLASQSLSSIILPSSAQFDYLCNMDLTKIYSEENVVTKTNHDIAQEETLEYLPIKKEDSKNNNDILNSFVTGASIVKPYEHPKLNEVLEMQINDSIMPDLSKSQLNDINCKHMNIQNVSTIQDHIEKEQILKINSDNGDTDRKSSSEQKLYPSYFKDDLEFVEDKRDSKDPLDNKKKKKNKINENKVMNKCIEDKEFCNNQINDIVKSSKENRNIEKVKEIAEYIKKYAHIYKDNKPIINKVEKKKSTINSKSNMIKSKLCIQGVEKPGGNKGGKDISNKLKVLKTYTRQKKHSEPCASKNLLDKSKPILCNIGDISATELNTINISTSLKSQDFCLCYDFGRLDASTFDTSYEHIHFWLHDDTVDLDSILSIYNDEEVIINDRTKLDEVKLCEVIEMNTKTSNICWNYFHMDVETSNEMHSVNNPIDELNTDNKSNTGLNISDGIKQIDSNTKSLVETSLNDNNRSYEVITIVEVVDNEIVTLESAKTDSIMTTDPQKKVFCRTETSHSIKENLKSNSPQLLEAIKQVAADSTDKNPEDIPNTTNKTSNDNQGTYKSSIMEIPRKETSLFEPESSNHGRVKRSLSADDTSEEPCPKKTVKCGVCNKLLIEAEWKKHVANKHNYIAWKTGQTFNFDDPALLQKFREKLETVGSLKCPNCHTQTRKFDKFTGHIKTCIKQKESSSRRVNSTKELVVCGVCQKQVQYLSWNEHIGKEHNYLAWIDGQDTLNIEDEAAVAKHLQNIIKSSGSLVCYKCGLNRKRVKIYLSHIETCNGSGDVRMDGSSTSIDIDTTIEEDTTPSVLDVKTIKCGVCKQEIQILHWTEHIAKEHNYLAWEDGLTPLNLDDEEMVRNHLQEFIRNSGGLRCYKCGLNRKRVKLYLSHIKTCDGEGVNFDESAHEDISMDQGTSDVKIFECGVCQAKVSLLDWNEHSGREHNYLAWKVGDTPLDVNDEDAVKEHLLDIVRKFDGLHCYKCGLNHRRVKLYLSHIKICDSSEQLNLVRSYVKCFLLRNLTGLLRVQWDESTTTDLNPTVNSTQIEISIDGNERIVKCGVCDQDVSIVMWIKHIGREHKYLAWQQGQEPLDLENEETVKAHLNNISRENNGLICNLCHVIKKYPKSFLQHVKDCNGVVNHEDTKIRNEPEISSFDVSDVKTDTVICGVCNNVVITSEWMKHMEHDHDYMGWLQGRPPLELKDPAAVQRHLIEVSRCTGGLKCKNCGLIRKYAKSYLQHINHCSNGGKKVKDASIMVGKDSVTCAVCSATVDPRDWRDHAMKKHYNVAWLVGATPIEINNPYGVEPYIKEYQQRHNNKLVCKTCGISRVSAVGFYAHIITCGKTEQETEIYKSLCEICNSKYLRIYKSQHMTMHREKEYAMERKLLIAKEKELKKEKEEPVEIVGGRRKAAEKAKTVIEKYTSNVGDASNCSKCGFSSDVESEMLNHVCVEKQCESSETDESVDIDYSSEEDDDTDIDSNISDEEREARDREQTKSKKHGDSSSAYRVQRLPYQIKNLNSYMRKSAEEFAALHLTDEDIFKHYRSLRYLIVPEADLPKYMPPVEESCKVRYREEADWVTYKRFEAKIEKELTTIFTGACIKSMCWVPTYVEEHDTVPVQEYLSVLSSLAPDTPRHFWYDTPEDEPALIQIWDCGNFTGVPELVMGLALDCGPIWSIDWCPSGARDVFDATEECNVTRRLGLLAVASANGAAYVFAVPHPSTTKAKGQFCKLRPVAELCLVMDETRKVYQATAVKWSTQKGHEHIVVGYADGTTAYFDLKNESPLLKCTENKIDVIYPYHDERAQNMCIEDLAVFPTVEGRQGCGTVVSGSVGGSGSRALHSHAAATRVLFPPHWPAALLAGDDNLVSQAVNELEWYGLGRRVGGMRAAGGCAWCGRLAASSAPLVRLMRPHPAYDDLHRQIIAMLQMVPFGNKRKRKNDELSMIMEPLTYEDTVLKYGIEFKLITAKDKNTQQKLSGIPREAFPERFPLADVVSMTFCPSFKNHHKLAIATHAGLIFIMNV
ncbi:unnamed protein product [Arctia plantaginis]|uniref:C2H2-type domain-containing protein n=1 Tax=Arctia plantaginis TaxID=874455 RepID=A0A8S0ZHM5_ARCPL|nr:unnamed protein product [Arctia plantaginis]